jgi:hypothetical protein
MRAILWAFVVGLLLEFQATWRTLLADLRSCGGSP